MSSPDRSPEHADLVQQPSSAPPAPNPLAQSANVMVSVPESVEVRLVDAGVLGDYEVWALVSSILSSAVVGFLVAFFQAPSGEGGVYLAITAVFAFLLLVSAATATIKRRRLNSRVKRIRFRLGEQIEDRK